jgi:hypothetical protein
LCAYIYAFLNRKISDLTYTASAWRHWGCVTKTQIQNMKKKLGEASEIDGFEDMSEADQGKITKAWEVGHVAEEDIPESAKKVDEEGEDDEGEAKNKKKKKKGAAKKRSKKTDDDDDNDDGDEDDEPKSKRARKNNEDNVCGNCCLCNPNVL